MHAACFALLMDCVGGETPLLEMRLHDICASTPCPDGFPCMDHNYDGTWDLDSSFYPWQDKRLNTHRAGAGNFLFCCSEEDPLNVPALDSVIDETAEASVLQFLLHSMTKPAKMPSPSSSSMFQLPWELHEMIAINLSTRDALALRLSSSHFLPLLHSHHFWRSRFHGPGQRSYFTEAHHLQTTAGLVSAYKRLSNIHHTPPVLNRQRVWRLVSRWNDLIKLNLTTPMNILPLHTDIEYEWFSVSGRIGPEGKALTRPDGCKTLFGGRTAVRQQWMELTVFLCAPGARDYVCGLQLRWHGARPVAMGYCNSKAFKILTVKSLAGFVVAVGKRGVHALQLVDEDGSISQWAGRPGDGLVTKRLSRRRPVLALEADFDVS
jgi:hypothetical protein